MGAVQITEEKNETGQSVETMVKPIRNYRDPC